MVAVLLVTITLKSTPSLDFCHFISMRRPTLIASVIHSILGRDPFLAACSI